jgi:hypothetical protein
MTDLKQPQTPAPAEGIRDPESDAIGSLKGLHHMSTTAGLSQEYVAVNTLSVVALVLGLASMMALIHIVLLIVPAAGVVCALVSIRQINRSSGTQTGKVLAWTGLVLSLVFTVLVLGRQAAQAAQDRRDQQEIAVVIDRFAGHIRDGEFEAAHAMFSSRFRQRVSLSQFTQTMRGFRENPIYGRMQTMDWNRRASFQEHPTEDIRYGNVMVVIHFDQVEAPFRQPLVVRKTAGQWEIEDWPSMFPAEGF